VSRGRGAGELEAAARAAFDVHLAACPECVAYLRSYARTIAAARDAHAVDPTAMPEALVRAIVAARRRGP
jgi:anti-sigma factor RsiW